MLFRSEELRAFLTSVILRPARTNNFIKWLRTRFTERNRPASPVVTTRPEPRPKPKTSAK